MGWAKFQHLPAIPYDTQCCQALQKPQVPVHLPLVNKREFSSPCSALTIPR